MSNLSDPPSQAETTERIEALASEEDTIHSIVAGGSDDTYWYYMVVYESHHEGLDYLNERYVQLARPESDREDSWKKNGINRRVQSMRSDAASLALAYNHVKRREAELDDHAHYDDFEVLFIDPSTGEKTRIS